MDAASAPKCAVCSHHHEQGSKCPVCGHTGKSRVFQLLRHRPSTNVFSVQGFDCLQRNPSIHNLDKGLWTFTKILRGRIFSPQVAELPTDPVARHLLAFIGDAPIATARWRLVTEAGNPVVEIDLLGVLVDKRQKGYGKQLLLHILEDINTRLLELGTSCKGLLAFVPDDGDFAVAAMKLFEAAGFQPDPQRAMRDNQSGFRMILLAPV